MIGLVNHSIETIRKIASDLRPGVLDKLGLGAAIEWQFEEFRKRSKIECHTSIEETLPEISSEKVTAIFQPHLYSRTRDFATEFSKSLSIADEVLLLDIYPARELPIEGVTSEMLFENINTTKQLCKKEEVLDALKNKEIEVLVTMGAGDIDQLVLPIKEYLIERYSA